MSTFRTYGRRGSKRKQDTEPEFQSPKKLKVDSAPSTPPKLARDLSHIFDAALSSSVPSTPTRLVKRMLGRSKTESSLGDESTASPRMSLDRNASLPSFVSPTTKPPVQLSSPSASTSSSPQRPAITNKRTYAGRSRSFLIAIPADQSLPEELQDDFNSRESYATLRSRWGVDNSEDDPYPEVPSPEKSNASTPNGSPSKRKGGTSVDVIQPLKSITEIRNKGENRRFLDEVGYLLEGMGRDETPMLKKASALEIVHRLCEPNFARQAKAADFLQSTWDAFIEAGVGKVKDKVLDTLFIAFAALVSRDIGSLTDLAIRDRSPSSSTSPSSFFISTLFSLLEAMSPDTDPLLIISQSSTPDGPLKKLSIMKSDRELLKTLYSTIASKARIFPSKTPISSSHLLTHTLTTLPTNLFSCGRTSSVLQSLRAQVVLATSSIRDLEFTDDDTKRPPEASSSIFQAVPFAVIHDLLALLDAYLLGQWAPSGATEHEECIRLLEVARDEWLADGLVAVGVAAELSASLSQTLDKRSKCKVPTESSRRCTEIVFRVLVSLTHSDPIWGQTLIQNDQVLMFTMRAIVRADELRHKMMLQSRRSSASRSRSMKGNIDVKEETESEEDDPVDNASSDEQEIDAADKSTNEVLPSATQALDWLCLSLGFLTNLVQVVDASKTILRETTFDSQCIRKTIPCIRVCSCPKPKSILNILITIYDHQLASISPMNHRHPSTRRSASAKDEPPDEDSLKLRLHDAEADADASFLLGHLSVLFGLLMMDSPENQEIVLGALPLFDQKDLKKEEESELEPLTTSTEGKLSQLIEHASELGVFYAVISRRVGLGSEARVVNMDGGDGDPGDEGTSERVENDAARGADVAKGVISFLHGLRDDL